MDFEWVIELQKHSWTAIYYWFKGLFASKTTADFWIYLTNTPSSIYDYIETNEIEVNSIIILYVTTLIVLMRLGGFLHSTIGFLELIYKIFAPITPDYLLKYFPFWILRGALYYLIIGLKATALVWKETGGAVMQVVSQMALSTTLPYIVIGMAAWNWRLFVCDSEGLGSPWLNNVPGGDKAVPVVGKLLCWLPYWSTVYSMVSEWYEWLKTAGSEVAKALITAFRAIIDLIKNIIGGVGGICHADIGNQVLLPEQNIRIKKASMLNETIDVGVKKFKLVVPKNDINIVKIPKIKVPSLPLGAVVGGQNGAFCKAMDKGKQDMIDYLVELDNAKCKVKAWDDGTVCGAYKCNVKYYKNDEGAKDALDKCIDPKGYVVKVEARRVAKEKADAKAAAAKKIADAKAAAKKIADAKAAAKAAATKKAADAKRAADFAACNKTAKKASGFSRTIKLMECQAKYGPK